MTAAATLRGVTMRFREHTALDDVSTAVARDRITGLLGRNGAGKRTLAVTLPLALAAVLAALSWPGLRRAVP